MCSIPIVNSNLRISLSSHVPCLFLELFEVRVVSHVLHSLQNTVQDRVKTLHDVKALLKILHDGNLVTNLLDVVLEVLSLV